jgi:hypothetical protein
MSFLSETKKRVGAGGSALFSKRVLIPMAIGAALAIAVHSYLGSRADAGKAEVPSDEPAEYLYLDGARVLDYLAQFDGGTFTSEQLTNKLSTSQDGKLAIENAIELGEKSTEEQSVTREIAPTAAGNFVELLDKLESHGGLEKIGLGRFRHEVHELPEGQFVMFRTHALRPPVYLNPYLAVRQRQTLSTLFPLPPKGDPDGERVIAEREAARHFRQSVGEDPRVVFALYPPNERELNERKAARSGGTEATAAPLTSAEEKAQAESHVEYLMPMDARLITEERSLIKFGGGEFTVVGKLVRSFPERGDGEHPAYVDSPTLETWSQPLARAPLALLCRTDPKCVSRMRQPSLDPEVRHSALEHSEEWALEALAQQTEIPKRGAVILPIAIFK